LALFLLIKFKVVRNMAGRPCKWKELDMPSRLEAVTGWCKQGYTDKEMCAMLGVSLSVFSEWKNRYPEFKEAIKSGKDTANGEILNAAFKQTTGFYYKEVVPIKVKVDRDTEEIQMVEVEKFLPPNPTMSIFMLKNRMPNDYKDKREMTIDGNMIFDIVPAPKPDDIE